MKYSIYISLVFILYADELVEFEAYENFMIAEYYMLNDSIDIAESYFQKAFDLIPQSSILLETIADLEIYKGEYFSAINHLKDIHKLGPYKKEIGFKLYDLYIEMNLNDEADSTLNILNNKFPNDIEILYMYIPYYYRNQNWPDLLLVYGDIYKLDPQNQKVLSKIYELGKSTDNLDLVKTILFNLKSISNSPLILSFLIKISDSQGTLSESINLIEEWIDNQGSSHESVMKLSLLYLRSEEYQRVIDIIKPIYIKGNATLELSKLYLIAHSKSGNFDEELLISKAIIKQYPESKFGYEALSSTFLQLGLLDNAIEVLLFAIIRFPDEINFNLSLGNIYYSMGDLFNGEKYLYKVLKMEPDHMYAKHTLAMIFEDRKEILRSDSLFNKIIQDDKYNSIYKNDYAYVLAEREVLSTEKLQYALELSEKAVQMEPENPAYLDTLGWINYKLGFYKKAQKYLEKSFKINSVNPVILEHLADIYAKINKFSDAIVLYEKILVIDSENQNIKDKINKIYE
tara:strand:- start:116 stop:1660 length:1545 start_codon:yes stop_codon:yes gene_type:complete